MAIIARIGIALTFIAAALPIAVSRAVGSNDCSDQEFWYAPNACCLPTGGPPSPPPPPKGTECPYTHYWGSNQGCCVPSNPPPKNGPPPQCPNHWDWNSSLRKCTPTPTQPSPPPSSPSGSYGHGRGSGGDGDEEDGHNHKRSVHKRTLHSRTRSAHFCPIGLDACPIAGARDGDYECLDTATELESCGGCTSLGSGQDCTTILGAWNIGCEQGSCAVYTCAGGFERAPDGKSCVPLK